MLQAYQKRTGWLIPYILIGAIFGLALTTGYSPAASRYTEPSEIDYGQQFNELIRTLRDNHVNPDNVSEEELFNIAIDAIMKKVGDKHGGYFDPEEYESFQQSYNPTAYGGIGVSLAIKPEGLIILDIFDNSPIQHTIIKPGDVITGAAGLGEEFVDWSVENPNADKVIEAIKGTPGTDVQLKISRNYTALGVFTVERVRTKLQTVFTNLSDTGILTIRISSFTQNARNDLMENLRDKGLASGDVLDSSVKGVVLDLRNNPGGALSAAVDISDLFLPKSKTAVRVIQRAQEPGGNPTAYDYPSANGRFFPAAIPRVVLINGGSASASEIVSGAVMTHREGIIMGVKSYGKGSVQTIFQLPGGSAIKTTTAIYLAGGEMEIDGVGVIPHAVVLQPDTIGLKEDDRIMNASIIRLSMDPDIDHQLNVSHTYINFFINGEHQWGNAESMRKALNKAHGAKTDVNGVCQEKGLRGCPPNELVLLQETEAAGWMMFPDDYDVATAHVMCKDGEVRHFQNWGWFCRKSADR